MQPSASAAVDAFHADASHRVLPGTGQPEAQLTAPVEALIFAVGQSLSLTVQTFRETTARALEVRPDLGVTVSGLLTGHVELKATGKGANPARFTDAHDRLQWTRLRELPNLVLTDGVEWALYRQGEHQASSTLPALSASPIAIPDHAASSLRSLLTEFLTWAPVAPANAQHLAEMLAPLTRIVRDEAIFALRSSTSAISQLARDWRGVLFPDSTDIEFADAYAQTLTYALLLARLDPATTSSGILTVSRASEALEAGHGLLAQALRLLSEPAARREISTGVGLLERFIGAVDPNRVRGGPHDDVWLYFYEYFLAAYDPRLREERGVYYTPVEVVRSQVRLVSSLLESAFQKPRAYAEDGVVFLDPAVGTGTYPLAAIDRGLDLVAAQSGAGAIPGRASVLARNIHAFELLVGPYTVAHLRLTQRLLDAGATLPEDGVNVFLTDTLESPDAAVRGQLPLALQRLGVEHERARAIKAETRVLVCMGNPPYDRQAFSEQASAGEDREATLDRLLGPFIELARGRTIFSHLASLYNLYVYFWRWALWKVFDTTNEAGIVSYITASSYLHGPGFKGMREVMRRTLDELWIIDLGGDSRGTRRSENVFAIQTPVAIAVGVRYGAPRPDQPAVVHYRLIEGSREEKLAALDAVGTFDHLAPWIEVAGDWDDPLMPATSSVYEDWPDVRDVFPWQTPGVKVGRAWPIGVTPDVLERRWERFAGASRREKIELMPNRRFGRRTTTRVGPTIPPAPSLDSLESIGPDSPRATIVPYGYRSLVRHYLIADPRLIDLQRPPLWAVHGDRQVYLVAFLTHPPGQGPVASATALIPDMHNFRGSYGGRHVVPLWRDADATVPNIAPGVLDSLSVEFAEAVTAEDLFAYAAAILGSERYSELFSEVMANGPKRLPIPSNIELFRAGAELGRELIRIETFDARYGSSNPRVSPGTARALRPIPSDPSQYPAEFSWDPQSEELRVGRGAFAPVNERVWSFQFSGLRPLWSWLGYRMREPAGRHSSDLDRITPPAWTPNMTDELLELIWTMETLVQLQVRLSTLVDDVVSAPIIGLALQDIPDELRDGPNPEATDHPVLWG